MFKKPMNMVLCLSVMAALLWSPLARASWVVEQVEKMGSAGINVKTTMTFGDKVLRADNAEMNSSIIMDFKGNKMYMIQHAAKMYMELDIAALSAQMKDMIERVKVKDQGSMVVIKETGEHKTINGFACEKLAVVKNGKEVGEIWVTKDIKDKDVSGVYQQFFEMAGAQNQSQQAIERLEGLKKAISMGFPIQTVHIEEDGSKNIVEVLSAGQKTVSADYFVPPKDYQGRPMALPGMMAPQKQK